MGVPKQPKIDLIYIDSGGGHRAAARALMESIRSLALDWDVRMVSIQELLDPVDFVRKLTGIPFQDLYNIMLRRGWTAGSVQLTRLSHLLIRLSHDRQVRSLECYWPRRRPDMVVSLIPHFNRALKQSLEHVCPGAPFVTVLTDMADYPPHFWIERQEQYVVCGSEHAFRQALRMGMPHDRVACTSGMILHPDFERPIQPDRRAERLRLGLRPDWPVGLVLFGGEGSVEMVEIARALNRPEAGVQLILLCGRNEEVRRKLSSLTRHIPMHIQGFTNRVAFYMELADFFIGKPGPGSISEAVAKRLPVIVRRDYRTLAHERYNCDWIVEQDLGIVIGSYRRLPETIRELMRPERYQRMRRNLARIRNRAVYEIPPLLERIVLSRLPGAPAEPDFQITLQ